MEGWLYAADSELPAEIGLRGSLFFVTTIEGEITWIQDGEETTISADHVAGPRDAANVRLRRQEDRGAHIMVWRVQRGTLRKSMRALGLPPPGDTLCWPFSPRPLTPQTKALFLEMRGARLDGAARAWWYGAKLLELTALLYPVTASDWPGKNYPHMRAEVRRAMGFLQKAYVWPVTLDDVAREAGLSSSHLSRVFHKEVGISLSHYLRSLRMEKAAQLLRSGESNVTDTAMSVGYTSISQFSGSFRSYFGASPRTFLPGNSPKKTPAKKKSSS